MAVLIAFVLTTSCITLCIAVVDDSADGIATSDNIELYLTAAFTPYYNTVLSEHPNPEGKLISAIQRIINNGDCFSGSVVPKYVGTGHCRPLPFF